MFLRGVVHSHELEDEVGHGGERNNNNTPLAKVRLTPSEKSGQEKQNNNDRNSDDGDNILSQAGARHVNQKLYREAEKEEKVELQQRDINLFKYEGQKTIKERREAVFLT